MSFSKRGKRCVWLGIVIVSITAHAQTPQHSYTLSALAAQAVQHLPLIKQKQAGIDAARNSLLSTRHSFLPNIRATEQVSLGSDNSLAGSYFTLGITPSTSAGVRAAGTLQATTGNMGVLYGEYELYNFGLNAARVTGARAGIDLAIADMDKESYLLELEVARNFFQVLKRQYRLEADRQNIARYDSIFRVISALATAGIRPGSDSSLARAELSKAKVTYNQTFGDLQQLKDDLEYLTGVPAETIALDTASLHPALHQTLSDSVPAVFPLTEWWLSQRNALRANDRVIRKSFLPKIMLLGSAWGRGSGIQYDDQYKSLGYGLGFQRFNYLAAVAVTYNLFNGLYRKDQLALNSIRLQSSELQWQQQVLSLHRSLQKADHALQSANANYLEIPVQLRSAGETYAQKLAQYKAGLISLIDLTNASFVLYRSQVDYSEGLTDLFQATLEKAATTGELNSFIQSFK